MKATPQKPPDIDHRAADLLEWMGAQPWADRIVLGGALALKHYVNYRTTHDCDAWWTPVATHAEKIQILSEVEAFLARHDANITTARQSWGDVDSVKLLQGDRAVFSFQIADRGVQLEPYQPSGWGGVLIESITDNVGSKMCALVERGAPRDFLDVFHVAKDTGWSVAQLWQVWQRKNPDRNIADAIALARLHLEGIQKRRPLETIQGATDRTHAQTVRDWYWKELLAYEQ